MATCGVSGTLGVAGSLSVYIKNIGKVQISNLFSPEMIFTIKIHVPFLANVKYADAYKQFKSCKVK